MELTYSSVMASADACMYRATLANADGDYARRDSLVDQAAAYTAYADTIEREY